MVGLDVLNQSTISIKIADNELASTCVDIIMFTMDYSHAVLDGVCVSDFVFVFLKGMGFSTGDRDNERRSSEDCAEDCQAGWRYNVCGFEQT